MLRCAVSVVGRRSFRCTSSNRFTTPLLQQQSYSTTPVLYKKKPNKNEEHPDMVQAIEEQEAEGIIQTINAPDGLTQEEIGKMMDEELAKMKEEAIAKQYLDWKPGERKRPLVVSNRLEDFEEELNPDKSVRKWALRDKRCGALAIKVGMMPLWDDWGERHPCTVLFLDTNVVLGHKTMDKHGYMAVQLAAGERKSKNVGKCVKGQYQHVEEVKDHPPYVVREFRVTDEDTFPPIGSRIHARHFVPGQNVDVAGITKGKGFQGAMKRHGFGGMPATHGTSKSHRALGSTGQCQDPGKVFKGKKMAGNMGNDRRTIQNLRILKIDRGRNLLYVKGAIPGQNGNFVEIKDSVKKPLWNTDKVQDELKLPPLPTFDYDETIDGTGDKYEELMPLPQKDPFLPDDEQAA
mmetsp:Transcript_18485/g.26091  ORF Transcript_18485/g.26091 Transcript_18485/m.26091 type:complete len:405 (+) Transcript_18485:166-1380(+)